MSRSDFLHIKIQLLSIIGRFFFSVFHVKQVSFILVYVGVSPLHLYSSWPLSNMLERLGRMSRHFAYSIFNITSCCHFLKTMQSHTMVACLKRAQIEMIVIWIPPLCDQKTLQHSFWSGWLLEGQRCGDVWILRIWYFLQWGGGRLPHWWSSSNILFFNNNHCF